MKHSEQVNDFELGPIRPPSEAGSLLLRVTRNCPWNRCEFCSLYKDEKFSLRPVEDVIDDIDRIRKYVDLVRQCRADSNPVAALQRLAKNVSMQGQGAMLALQMTLNWIRAGTHSVFLQDANTLIVKPDDLVVILNHLTSSFPSVRRVTSYARSKTLSRISAVDMRRIADAGLNRIHVGIESGSDRVLKLVDKGVTKLGHIVAGQKVKQAGIELSVYYMPGLGGVEYSTENALETADVINQIDPDFIRIRTLAIPSGIPLHQRVREGSFTPLGDKKVVEELLLFIEALEGIHSVLKSDHILNLLQEVEGRLPEDKARMLAQLNRFLNLPADDQLHFMVGRRSGIFSSLDDLSDPYLCAHAEQVIADNRVTEDNLEKFTAEMMKRFI